jgi:hypothetical protein
MDLLPSLGRTGRSISHVVKIIGGKMSGEYPRIDLVGKMKFCPDESFIASAEPYSSSRFGAWSGVIRFSCVKKGGEHVKDIYIHINSNLDSYTWTEEQWEYRNTIRCSSVMVGFAYSIIGFCKYSVSL